MLKKSLLIILVVFISAQGMEDKNSSTFDNAPTESRQESKLKMIAKIKHLIALNANNPDLRLPGQDDTFILWATCSTDDAIDISEQLLKMGANPNVRDLDGNIPLDAASFGAVKSTELLLKWGADPNAPIFCGSIFCGSMLHRISNPYSSHSASEIQRLRIAKHLLEYGACIDSENAEGKTPLEIAQNHFPNSKLVNLFESYTIKQKIS